MNVVCNMALPHVLLPTSLRARDEFSGQASAKTVQLVPRVFDMRNEKALRPMRSREVGGRLWRSSVEGATCRETVLSNMRSQDARPLDVQPLRRTKTARRILCLAREAHVGARWHAMLQHVRVVNVGLSCRHTSESTRAAFAAPHPAGARASDHRGGSARDSGSNRAEVHLEDERKEHTVRDGVTEHGAQGRCSRRHR